MRRLTKRSFAVEFEDSEDTTTQAWLARLDALVAELEPLQKAGRCKYVDTAHETLAPEAVVTYQTLREVFKKLKKPVSVADQAMQTLFNLYVRGSEIRVRFYCIRYAHTQEECECLSTIHTYKRHLAHNPRSRFMALTHDRAAPSWLIDRGDLLALTDEQIEAFPSHTSAKKSIKLFIEWLREHPDAT